MYISALNQIEDLEQIESHGSLNKQQQDRGLLRASFARLAYRWQGEKTFPFVILLGICGALWGMAIGLQVVFAPTFALVGLVISWFLTSSLVDAFLDKEYLIGLYKGNFGKELPDYSEATVLHSRVLEYYLYNFYRPNLRFREGRQYPNFQAPVTLTWNATQRGLIVLSVLAIVVWWIREA